MTDNNKEVNENLQEELNDVVVESQENTAEEKAPNIDFMTVDYDTLSDEDKKKGFDSLKNTNLMMMTIMKGVEQQMKELEQKAQGKVSEDSYMRLVADFDNYKRRNSTARSEGYNEGQNEVLTALVDIVDNLERAMPMITDEKVLSGIKMVHTQSLEKLKNFGVVEIEALGQQFDPMFHNCVMTGEAETPEQEDTVIEVFQKGYQKNEAVIRYAFVKVAK